MKNHSIWQEFIFLPVLGFVAKASDEFGLTKMILAALGALLLLGIGYHLTTISTDVRDIRSIIVNEAADRAKNDKDFAARLSGMSAKLDAYCQRLDEHIHEGNGGRK